MPVGDSSSFSLALRHSHPRFALDDYADLPIRLPRFLAVSGKGFHFVGRDGGQDAAVGLWIKKEHLHLFRQGRRKGYPLAEVLLVIDRPAREEPVRRKVAGRLQHRDAVEMDTAVRHNLPVVAVVVNDGAWGMIKAAQIGMYGKDRIVASELKNVRYDKWAEGFGGHGEFVEKPGDIRPALERALASGKPACVNVACQTIPINV